MAATLAIAGPSWVPGSASAIYTVTREFAACSRVPVPLPLATPPRLDCRPPYLPLNTYACYDAGYGLSS